MVAISKTRVFDSPHSSFFVLSTSLALHPLPNSPLSRLRFGSRVRFPSPTMARNYTRVIYNLDAEETMAEEDEDDDDDDDGEDDEDEGRRRWKWGWETRVWPRLSVSLNVFDLLPLIFPDFSGIVPDEGCKRVESSWNEEIFFFLNLSPSFSSSLLAYQQGR